MWVGFTQSDGAENPRAFAQPAAAVPEPTTISLVAVGVLAAVAARRRGLFRFGQ
ncbi:MAG: PEP-CTERM sorting domain-containing protein [Chthoniobacterales bacterium]